MEDSGHWGSSIIGFSSGRSMAIQIYALTEHIFEGLKPWNDIWAYTDECVSLIEKHIFIPAHISFSILKNMDVCIQIANM